MRLAMFLVILTLFLPGCAGRAWKGFPPSGADALVWPAAPEQPRLAYVQSIRSGEDLFGTPGGWAGFTRIFAGARDSRMAKPFALALHPGGGLLVADQGRQTVHYYDWSRGKYVQLGPKRKGGLPSPVGVAVLPDGDALVSDSRLQSIERFSIGGKYLGPFVSPGSLERPAGIAVDGRRGRVYVADAAAHIVVVFDLRGTEIERIGGRGEAPGRFNFPTHLAVNDAGELAVTDALNFRVQVFDGDGKPLREAGKLGDAPGQFSRPKGVAFDGKGNLVVVEGLFDALQFFDTESRLLLSAGGPGGEPGQFWLAAGLAADLTDGLLFVADSYNARVQVFRFLDAPAADSGVVP
ncbi:6-bladed beta-propeller [Candidatus Poribacteria bacterium]|nr:6-bladed beta-propeller [Candidatus Poribacteria bacterium]